MALKATAILLRTGNASISNGTRCAVVFSRTAPARSVRNSGSVCAVITVREMLPRAAGFIGLNKSNSPKAPPVAAARVLTPPTG